MREIFRFWSFAPSSVDRRVDAGVGSQRREGQGLDYTYSVKPSFKLKAERVLCADVPNERCSGDLYGCRGPPATRRAALQASLESSLCSTRRAALQRPGCALQVQRARRLCGLSPRGWSANSVGWAR